MGDLVISGHQGRRAWRRQSGRLPLTLLKVDEAHRLGRAWILMSASTRPWLCPSVCGSPPCPPRQRLGRIKVVRTDFLAHGEDSRTACWNESERREGKAE